MLKVLICFLEWLPVKERAKCILHMPQRWTEEHFSELPIKIADIFYNKQWSLEFLETYLKPEDVDMWDHISTYYTLTDAFCERNIEWLNFYELVYSQVLSKQYYLRHVDRIDWTTSVLDKKNIYTELYLR